MFYSNCNIRRIDLVSFCCRKRYKLLCLFLIFLNSNIVFSQKFGLVVSPERLVFDGKNCSFQRIYITNGSNDSIRLNIYVKEFDQSHYDTSISMYPKDSASYNNKILEVYPKTILLAPGETQVCVVRPMNMNMLKDGEYRQKLILSVIPDSSIYKPLSKPLQNKINIKLVPTYYYVVPVFVRVGKIEIKASISAVKHLVNSKGIDEFLITVKRMGRMSVLGKMELFLFDTISKKRSLVAELKSVSIVVPKTERLFRMDIEHNKKSICKRCKYNIVYTTYENNRPSVVAETFIDVNKEYESY